MTLMIMTSPSPVLQLACGSFLSLVQVRVIVLVHALQHEWWCESFLLMAHVLGIALYLFQQYEFGFSLQGARRIDLFLFLSQQSEYDIFQALALSHALSLPP